jgi:hypothetical protein
MALCAHGDDLHTPVHGLDAHNERLAMRLVLMAAHADSADPLMLVASELLGAQG